MIEAWLGGPVSNVDPVLMPAAHSLLQVRQEIPVLLDGLDADQIWARPAASASIGFHAIHLAGATDRLLTYARGEQLSSAQLAAAKSETTRYGLDASQLVAIVQEAMDAAVEYIRRTSAERVTDAREVGRQRLPSTVLGLIFHAAEHATRHAGQIATLRKIVTS